MDRLIKRIKEQVSTKEKKFKAVLYVFSSKSKEEALSLDGKKYAKDSMF